MVTSTPDDLGAGVGRDLNVVRGAEPPVGHLHHPRLGVRGGDAGLGPGRLGLLGRADRRELGQGCVHPRLALAGGPGLGGGLAGGPARDGRVVLGGTSTDLSLGLGQAAAEAGLPAEGGRPRARPDARPVLRHARERDELLLEQDRESLGQERIQGRPMGHPEVAHGVGVHVHPTTDPAVGVVGLAEPGEFSGTAHPVARGVEPEGEENLGAMAGRPRLFTAAMGA